MRFNDAFSAVAEAMAMVRAMEDRSPHTSDAEHENHQSPNSLQGTEAHELESDEASKPNSPKKCVVEEQSSTELQRSKLESTSLQSRNQQEEHEFSQHTSMNDSQHSERSSSSCQTELQQPSSPEPFENDKVPLTRNSSWKPPITDHRTLNDIARQLDNEGAFGHCDGLNGQQSGFGTTYHSMQDSRFRNSPSARRRFDRLLDSTYDTFMAPGSSTFTDEDSQRAESNMIFQEEAVVDDQPSIGFVSQSGITTQDNRLNENAEISSAMTEFYDQAVCLGTHQVSGWLCLADPDTGRRFFGDPQTREISWSEPRFPKKYMLNEMSSNGKPGQKKARNPHKLFGGFGMPSELLSHSNMESLLNLAEDNIGSFENKRNVHSPVLSSAMLGYAPPLKFSKRGRRFGIFKHTPVQILLDPSAAPCRGSRQSKFKVNRQKDFWSHAKIPPPTVFRCMLNSLCYEQPTQKRPFRRRSHRSNLDDKMNTKQRKSPIMAPKQQKTMFICPPGGWKEVIPYFGSYMTEEQHNCEHTKNVISRVQQQLRLQRLQQGTTNSRQRHARKLESRNALSKILDIISTHVQLKAGAQTTLNQNHIKELIQYQMTSVGFSQVYHCREQNISGFSDRTKPTRNFKPEPKPHKDSEENLKKDMQRLRSKELFECLSAKSRATKYLKVPTGGLPSPISKKSENNMSTIAANFAVLAEKLRARPTDLLEALHLAHFLLQHNYYEQAFDTLSFALKLVTKGCYEFLVVTDVCSILQHLSYLSIFLQDFAEAVSYATAALALAPTYTSVMLETARILDICGQDISAEQLYLSCLLCTPQDHQVLVSYAGFNERKGNYDTADRYMARGLKLCKDVSAKTEHLISYAEFLMNKRKAVNQADRCFTNAIKFLNASSQPPSGVQRVYFTLGRWAQFKRSETTRAKAYYEAVLDWENQRTFQMVETHRIPATCYLAVILMKSERLDLQAKASELLQDVLFEVGGGWTGRIKSATPWMALMLAFVAEYVLKDLTIAEKAYECAADLCLDSPLPGIAFAQFLELTLDRPKEEVQKNYAQLIDRYPTSIEVLVTVAGFYSDWVETLPSSSIAAGELAEEAFLCAQQAYELSRGQSSVAVRCLGVVRARAHDTSALELLRSAYSLTPKDPCVLRTLAMHIYCRRNADNNKEASTEAAFLLEQSLEVEHHHVPTLNALAFIYLQSLNNHKAAEGLLLKAANSDHVTVDTLRTLAHLYHVKNDKKKSTRYFKQACKRFPEDSLTLVRYAQYLTSSPKTCARAKKYFEAAMQFENLSPECYMMYAIYLDQYEKNSQLSFKFLMKAATSKVQPTLAPAFYLVGRHIEADQSRSLNDAGKWYTWALNITPVNAGSAAAFKQLLGQIEEDKIQCDERYKKAKGSALSSVAASPSNISRLRKSCKLHQDVHKYAQLRSRVLSNQLNWSDHVQWSLLLKPGWEEDYLHILEGRDSWMSLHLLQKM